MQRVVWLSKIVWEWVMPWLVPQSQTHPLAPAASMSLAMDTKHAVTMFGVGEGVFPLVGLVSSSLLRHYASHHLAIDAAAEAGATSCVNWLITNRHTAKHRDDGEGGEWDGIVGAVADVWTSSRKNNNNNNKEVIWVLGGLCGGGHLEMAKTLVDGRWPGGGLTWRSCCSGGNGIVGDGSHGGIGDHVRDVGILKRVCKNGHMDVAKWAVETFHIRDPWEFVGPFCGALSHGHLELAQWLFNTFHLGESFRYYDGWPSVHQKACKSESLEVVKWCFQVFPVDNRYYSLVTGCSKGKKSNCVDICKYVASCVSVRGNSFRYARRVDVLKWSTSMFPSAIPNNYSLVSLFCEGKGGLELVKFAVEEFSTKPTPPVFIAACRTEAKEGVALVRWLSTKVTLSPEHLCDSLATALARDKTSIATWLDETFNIMKQLPRWSFTSGYILCKICKKIRRFKERVKGVQWILNHPEMRCIEESLVVKAVNKLVKRRLSTVPLLLIEKFTISEPTRTQLLVGILKESVEHDGITQAKKIISMGEFTKDSVARCLANAWELRSSKAIKWLITHFQLDHDVTSGHSRILFNLITNGKESCTEWLINKFHITLDEVLSLAFKIRPFYKFDLFTWEMIMRQFPGAITAEVVRQKFMALLMQSPVIAQSAIMLFPDELTMSGIMDFAAMDSDAFAFPLATRCWLRDHNPEIWPPTDSDEE